MAIIAGKSNLDTTMLRASVNTRDFLLKYRWVGLWRVNYV